jgi:NAD(P)H-hydrate epimerase
MDTVSSEEMAEIDEKVPEKYGITVSRMMENAGYQIADFIRKKIDPDGLTIYAGKGNNGGDALAAARRLHLWNYNLEVVLATDQLDGIREEELEILENLGVEINLEESRRDFRVALEGLIGYNLNGKPRPPFDSMIEQINSTERVVSIDIPTGIFADTGEKTDPSVEPDYTLTLAMPKKGMNQQNSGEIWAADISIPAEAYREYGFEGDIFEEKSLVKLSQDD